MSKTLGHVAYEESGNIRPWDELSKSIEQAYIELLVANGIRAFLERRAKCEKCGGRGVDMDRNVCDGDADCPECSV